MRRSKRSKRSKSQSNVLELQKTAAKVLGWSLEGVRSTSLQSLRDLVRPLDPDLSDALSLAIRTGQYVSQFEPGSTRPKKVVRLSQADTLRAMGFSPTQIANFKTKG